MLRPVDQNAHESRSDDDRIKARGLARLEFEPLLPPEDSPNGERRGAGEHWNGKQAGADDPERE